MVTISSSKDNNTRFFEKSPNAPRTINELPFPCPFECEYFKNNKCPFDKMPH